MEIRTDPDNTIAWNGDEAYSVRPLYCTTREEAFRVAAQLVVLGERLPSETVMEGKGSRPTFEDVLEAVRST